MSSPLLSIEGLEVRYHLEGASLAALDGVDLQVLPGEIVGLVGESGCGKSSLSLALLRLLPPNGEIAGGRVLLSGRDLLAVAEEEMRRVRGGEIAMIFQDPMTSLNPTFTSGVAAGRGAALASEREADRGQGAPATGGGGASPGRIPDPWGRIEAYPHEFSGGQRQRIMIATCLLLEPSLLVADEPTSALDVTLEVQILELLRRLRDERGAAILFITHNNLGVVSQICDRVVVMYAGRVVEEARCRDPLRTPPPPLHPGSPRRHALARPARWAAGHDLPAVSRAWPSSPQAARSPTAAPMPAIVAARASRGVYATEGSRVRCYMYDAAIPEEWTAGPAREDTRQPGPVRVREPIRSAASGRGPEKALLQVPGPCAPSTTAERPDRVALGRERGAVRAVDGVDLEIRRGEILGLVGESGSGKTKLGETILPARHGDCGRGSLRR